MNILGIETTCDETGASVVKDGRSILSNIVASSVDLQKKYGGVVPEVAAREQVRVIVPVIKEALEQAFRPSRTKNSRQFGYPIDAIAVAHGPGLIGSLLIGIETAKALALAWNKPLIGVNHLVGHVYANWLAPISNFKPSSRAQVEGFQISNSPKFPIVALIVSGGHTDLVLMTDHGKFKWLGGTLDDAAGEAFDKVARLLDLDYPGGPEIELLASRTRNNKREARNFKFPRPMIDSGNWNFSFSGLKTAVVNRIMNHELTIVKKAEIAHQFQEAVVDVLVVKTIAAAKKFGANSIVVGGGVAANSQLRNSMTTVGQKNRLSVFFPDKSLSIDNGAMIACAAFYNFVKVKPLTLQADPGLHFV